MLLSLLHLVSGQKPNYWTMALNFYPTKKSYYQAFAEPIEISDDVLDRYIFSRGRSLLPERIFCVPAFNVRRWLEDMKKMDLLRGQLDRKRNTAPLILTEPLADKDVFLLPYHQAPDHWYLYIWVKSQKHLYIMDSLRGGKKSPTAKDIKEANIISNIVVKLHQVQNIVSGGGVVVISRKNLTILDVPIQDDVISCGVFLCLFAEFIMRHPTDFMEKARLTELKKLVASQKISEHRSNIIQFILDGL